MSLKITDSPNAKDWNQVLEGRGEGDYRQCIQYGDSIENSGRNLRAVRFLAMDERPLGILQGIYGRKVFSRLLMGGSSGGGPVLVRMPEQKTREVVSGLLKTAREFARRKMISSERIHTFARHGMAEMMINQGFSITRNTNIFTVKLGQPSDVWAGMKKNKRKNVRRASDRNVEVSILRNQRGIDIFYDMFVEFSRRRSFKPFDKIWARSLWKAFEDNDMIRVFVAKAGGDAVASALVLNHLDAAFCPYTCSTEAAGDLRANDMLHWRVIEWAASKRMSRYNMGEVFTDRSAEQYGLFRWKRGFGGSIDRMQILDMKLLPLVQRVKRILP